MSGVPMKEMLTFLHTKAGEDWFQFYTRKPALLLYTFSMWPNETKGDNITNTQHCTVSDSSLVFQDNTKNQYNRVWKFIGPPSKKP